MRGQTTTGKIVFAVILLAAGGVSARQNNGSGHHNGGDAGNTGNAGKDQTEGYDRAGSPRLEQSCSRLPVSGVCLELDKDKIELLHVQGNVYMLAGAGANVTVQIGERSVLIVDTGTASMSEKVIAAVRALTDKPIFFIVDTSMDDDHAGGNASVAAAGSALANGFGQDTSSITGSKLASGAAIFAHINVLNRMSAPTGQKASAPEEAWPTDTYESDDWRFYNGESVYIFHVANAHTDGDSIVLFRGADVLSTGDIFEPLISYPIVDNKRGGGIDGVVAGLNQVIELMVAKDDEEGGTYVIPGHGPICDRNDVVNYRDMVTVLRARIAAMVKEGKTLEQVKATKPTLDYDGIGHYGATRDAFIEAVYQNLKAKTP